MIEQVTGNILKKSPTFCVLGCNGIGLGIHISLYTFESLQHTEKELVTLQTYLHVREDALQLFGFAEPSEKEMFKLLISVSGIGARLALSVLSGLDPQALMEAISEGDEAELTRIPGVGRKTAQRLILELKEKIPKVAARESVEMSGAAAARPSKPAAEALRALIALGYKEFNSERAIHKVLKRDGSDLSVEEIIKRALKEV